MQYLFSELSLEEQLTFFLQGFEWTDKESLLYNTRKMYVTCTNEMLLNTSKMGHYNLVYDYVT